MEKDKTELKFDDKKCEGLDIPAEKEIEAPQLQRIIELKIVDTMGMPDK